MLRASVVILCLTCASFCVLALPHCEKTEIPKRLLVSNVINVVYTMESSCKMCVQQASTMPRLKRYLEKKGIKTHFIIGVSHKADKLSGLVPHIQVNSRHVWRALGEQNNHFYIIDRCGRLVYEVINPWSNLNLSFVKAGIASAAYSHPCSLCPVDYTHTQKEEIQEFPSIERHSQTLAEDMSSLKMNVRLRHTHRGDPNVYNYIVKVVGRPEYHGHLPQDQGIQTQTSQSTTTTPADLLTEISQSEKTEFLTSKSSPEEMAFSTSTNREDETTEPSILISRTIKYSANSLASGVDESTESPSSISSISYDLSTESVSRASTENSNVDKITETSTESIKNKYTLSTQTQSENTEAHNDYDNGNTSDEPEEKLQEEDEAELRNLRAHYRRIIDWMDFFSDEEYY